MEQPGPASGTIFYVKHVVCPRGIRVLRKLLAELGLTPRRVELGEAEVAEAADAINWPALERVLLATGLALLRLRLKRHNRRLITLRSTVIIDGIQREIAPVKPRLFRLRRSVARAHRSGRRGLSPLLLARKSAHVWREPSVSEHRH